jgi:response regulator RpfG family c-di-GMP phosphodiesterase
LLIVDDSVENLQLLSALLKDLYKIKVAKSGEKALEIAQQTPMPDLILLDVMMPGMYGLEVCKSLNLPQDFLENAHNIRLKYHPESTRILDYKQSHFNSEHIVGGICEKCKINLAIDVHHLVFQKEANDKGRIIKGDLSFNKNENANLINLCEKCHNEIHKSNKKYKKTKTTKGQILQEV